MNTRHEVVRRLIDGALQGMVNAAEGSTGTEVVSAYLSLAYSAVLISKKLNIPADQIRSSLHLMLMECDDPKTKVM